MDKYKRFLREELGKWFTLKVKSIGYTEQCLGNKVSQVTLENIFKRWSFISSQRAQDAVKNEEEYEIRVKLGPLLKAKSLWFSNYRPYADDTHELTPLRASYYQSLIGVLRWIIELERGDLAMEVIAMASMMALPREGHLNVVFQMFSFLKSNWNVVTLFDFTESDRNQNQFPTED